MNLDTAYFRLQAIARQAQCGSPEALGVLAKEMASQAEDLPCVVERISEGVQLHWDARKQSLLVTGTGTVDLEKLQGSLVVAGSVSCFAKEIDGELEIIGPETIGKERLEVPTAKVGRVHGNVSCSGYSLLQVDYAQNLAGFDNSDITANEITDSVNLSGHARLLAGSVGGDVDIYTAARAEIGYIEQSVIVENGAWLAVGLFEGEEMGSSVLVGPEHLSERTLALWQNSGQCCAQAMHPRLSASKF